jgi:lipopolysaccharide export system permease protein
MAVTAAGGRLGRLFLPLVIAGALLSVVAFALGEFGVPASAAAARDLEDAITGAAFRPSMQRNGKVWLRAEDGALVKIDFHLEGGNHFRGVSVFRTGEDRLEEIIRAAEGSYRPATGNWVLRDVTRYETATGRLTRLEEMPYPALGSPELVGKAVLKPYEMGLFELRRYLGRLEDAGFRNTRLEVEFHAKLATPVVGLIMVVLGISFAAARSMGGLAATAVGLVVSLLYWLGFTLALSLGYAGVLPAPAAAWAMPLIFGGAALALYRRIPE